ncbi:MAG: NlpC/P60 family protein [Nocardioides sp.]|nr:NlpC/P60 family protein [Nocardioides sp.]
MTLALLNPLPGYAEPDVDEVRGKVETLYHKAEQASERFNEARVAREAAQTRLRTLRADLTRQVKRHEEIRDQVAAALVQDYQGQALSTTSQVVLSDDPDAFLEQLSAVSAFNDQRGAMMADFTVEAKQLEIRRAAAKEELAALAELEKTLADEQAEIDVNAAEAEELLEELEARAAAAAAPSRSGTRTAAAPAPANVPVSGRAKAAVDFALAQVGDAYVWGAAGPDAYDCSGLTMKAWAAAGVSLPHSSSGQMSSTTPVTTSDLQPGDLVFYYSPVSHVGMYIGNGQIVDAANPSTGVRIAGLHSMPLVGAGRPG